MTVFARDVADQLLSLAHGEELAALCQRRRIALLVLFGSALRPDADPSDIDLALLFRDGAPGDLLSVLDDLYGLTGYEGFDLMDLRHAGPVAREHAFVGGTTLYQAEDGLFARRQSAAIMERIETDRLRRLQLELMSR